MFKTISSKDIPRSETFNRDCFCTSLDMRLLREALESELGQPGLADLVRERNPYVFSSTAAVPPTAATS